MSALKTYQKLLSYLFPVRVAKSSGTKNKVLELFLYRGQLQLATLDALYSDGTRYRPLKIAFKAVKDKLSNVKEVLLLGTGLASAVHMLSKRGHYPAYTLIEHDNIVLDLAKEYLPKGVDNVEAYCTDALSFMNVNEKKYDLLIVDIFDGRVAPEFVTSESFLLKCRQSLNSDGIFVLNYIINGYPLWEDAIETIKTVFPDTEVLEYQINRVIVATA